MNGLVDAIEKFSLQHVLVLAERGDDVNGGEGAEKVCTLRPRVSIPLVIKFNDYKMVAILKSD